MKDEIDYILFIDNGADRNMKTVEAESGIPVVFIDTFYDYQPGCRFQNFSVDDKSKCFGRSSIDIAQRIEELAIALGVDVPINEVNADKQDACDAAANFTATMEIAHEKGLRISGTIFGIAKDDEGNDAPYFRTFDPTQLWHLRTLEELGAPMLHSNGTQSISNEAFFFDCPAGEVSESCNGNVSIPIDFWFIDSRSYLLILENFFTTLFPDKAIIAGQHYYYARNDGTITFKTIARQLNAMSARLAVAERMHPTTECTPADPKSLSFISAEEGGLGDQEYVCYNKELIQEEYLKCPENVAPPPMPSPPTPTPNPPTPSPPTPSPPTPSPPGPPTPSTPAETRDIDPTSGAYGGGGSFFVGITFFVGYYFVLFV